VIEERPATLPARGEFLKPFPAACAVYLALLTAAEVVTNLVSPDAGLLLHGVILLAFLVDAAHRDSDSRRNLLLVLSLLPLIRLLSLALPLAEIPRIDWYVAITAPGGVAAVLAARHIGVDRRGICLTVGNLGGQAAVSLTGIALGFLEYRILQPVPLDSELSLGVAWLPALILLTCTGFFEELIFRGLLQSAAVGALGRFGGIVYTALVFAVFHLGWRSALDLLVVFAVGLFFGWVVARTHSLLGVTISHGLANVVLFLVLPFLPIGQQ
jgi:CAAX protease family protein